MFCTGFLLNLAQHLRIINSVVCTISFSCTFQLIQKPQLLTIKSTRKHKKNTPNPATPEKDLTEISTLYG